MESNFLFSAYQAGAIAMRVTANHTRPHHAMFGYLRQTRTSGLIVSNYRGDHVPAFNRAWAWPFADGQMNYAAAQMLNLPGAPPHWPYGLDLKPVPETVPI